MSQANEHGPHIMSYRALITVWIVLLALTALTVWVSTIHLGFLNVAAALIIASCKGLVVVAFFMHLKYENAGLKTMVLMAFVILAIFIGLTFFDVVYR
ncbi:MAG: cytochrome-c oxidase [Acidobacteria bacterium CG_4_9_14_3_um_filter_49_7]|nr:MAG: cytochrome-c oxidase [Acidobacteria bacterium CG_4_9_14_3_um_filter_49_7]